MNIDQFLSTTAILSNGKIVTIYVPDLGKAQTILDNNNNNNSIPISNSDLPGPQLLFYLTLLSELSQQIPNFNISNAELVKLFANSWRNSSPEYTNEFIILAEKLGLS